MVCNNIFIQSSVLKINHLCKVSLTKEMHDLLSGKSLTAIQNFMCHFSLTRKISRGHRRKQTASGDLRNFPCHPLGSHIRSHQGLAHNYQNPKAFFSWPQYFTAIGSIHFSWLKLKKYEVKFSQTHQKSPFVSMLELALSIWGIFLSCPQCTRLL